jgi:pSer/pThr/pTyr-binding forkhead associated (FHA) protein
MSPINLEVQGMTDLVILNGPEIGRALRIKEGVSYLGRSLDNDIRIEDKTISRKHLKIESTRGRLFVTDLSSRNGTFCDGKYVTPGHEVEVKEGVPLAIGMTVICFGEGCREQIVPFLDTASLILEKGKKEDISSVSEDRRSETDQKREDLLAKVSRSLKGPGPLNVILEQLLGHISHHLKRVDRGAFVLVDPETLKTVQTICTESKSCEDTSASYSQEVIQRVLEDGKPLIFSKGYTGEESTLVNTLKVQKIESVMCVPLINGPRILGAMYVDSLKRPDGFRKDDLLVLLDIGQRVALAVESDRLASDLEEAARSLIGNVED